MPPTLPRDSRPLDLTRLWAQTFLALLIVQSSALVSHQPSPVAHSPHLELRAVPSAHNGELARLRGGESLPITKICSPQAIAGAQCVLEGVNFALSYLSPDTMVDTVFTLRQPKDRSLATYLATFTGQHGFPWMVMSGIYAASGKVPAEYILASSIASAFYSLDIALRVARVCEAQGVSKSTVIAGAPIYGILSVLSMMVYRQMT